MAKITGVDSRSMIDQVRAEQVRKDDRLRERLRDIMHGSVKDSDPEEEDPAELKISEKAQELAEKLRDERGKYMDLLVAEQNLEAAKQQGEAVKKEVEELSKIMMVFRRMSKGDIVPSKDEQKLMDYDKDIYKVAKSMQAAAQQMKKKLKKHKSLWEEEEEKQDGGSADPGAMGAEMKTFIADQEEAYGISGDAAASDAAGGEVLQ